jgi:AraC-like DNA-binding protein
LILSVDQLSSFSQSFHDSGDGLRRFIATNAGRLDMGQVRQAPVPYVRASHVAPFMQYCSATGLPLERLCREAKLPASALGHQDGLVPLHACYRFLDTVVRYTDRPGIGVDVAGKSSVFALGSLGRALRATATVLDYLVTGTRLISSHSNSGLAMWLNLEGEVLRVNQRVVDGEGAGPGIADSYTLALTLNTFAELMGDNWQPVEVRLGRGSARAFRDSGFSPLTTVTESAPHTSFTIPLALLSHRLGPPGPQAGRAAPAVKPSVPLPETFIGSIEQLIELQLREGNSRIAAVAEAAGLSARSLQRRLAASGTSFNALLASGRSALARQLLQDSDLPITAIAAELGYTDASNFSRAFCRQNGLAPVAFRRAMQAGPEARAGDDRSGVDLH